MSLALMPPQASSSAIARHKTSPSSRMGRLLALTALGVVLGAGGAVLSVSMVQAEGQESLVEYFQQEHARRESNQRAARAAQPAYYAPAAYAPTRNIILPLFQTREDGRIAPPPPVNLNPFAKKPALRSASAQRKRGETKLGQHVALDTVSGSANTARTICVRLCDGFQAPIGYLAANSDMGAHEVLCKAMNPGIPVKVFRVPAGATTIDNAVAADGKTYASLPMAYSHEKSADPACRPRIVQAHERRVSIFKDFTLRPGDAVVVEGSAKVFNGASRYPFQSADFRDFRASDQLGGDDRRRIDTVIGQSFTASAKRTAMRAVRLKEASLGLPRGSVSDMPLALRGAMPVALEASYVTSGRQGPVRVIAPEVFGAR